MGSAIFGYKKTPRGVTSLLYAVIDGQLRLEGHLLKALAYAALRQAQIFNPADVIQFVGIQGKNGHIATHIARLIVDEKVIVSLDELVDVITLHVTLVWAVAGGNSLHEHFNICA